MINNFKMLTLCFMLYFVGCHPNGENDGTDLAKEEKYRICMDEMASFYLAMNGSENGIYLYVPSYIKRMGHFLNNTFFSKYLKEYGNNKSNNPDKPLTPITFCNGIPGN